MRPSVSINTLCLEAGRLDERVATVGRLGASAISAETSEILDYGPDRARRLFKDAGLEVTALTHRAFGFVDPVEAEAQRTRLSQSIGLARDVGAGAICMTTGGRGPLSWLQAADRFAAEIAPCAEEARLAGVALSLEPTSHLFSDASLAHRLTDTTALARMAGINVSLDIFPCWTDADLEAAIVEAGTLCTLVQVSDYVPGDRGLPCRAVPGDGAVPLGDIINRILETGYRGPFDLEVIGPRLFDAAREAGLRRGLAFVNKALDASLALRA